MWLHDMGTFTIENCMAIEHGLYLGQAFSHVWYNDCRNDNVVDFLLNNLGACPDPVSGVGDTPLMLATKYNHLRCIARLMMAGADPSIENFQGKNVFQIAEESGSFEALPYLQGERTQVPVQDDSERLESIGVYSISSQDIRSFLTSFA